MTDKQIIIDGVDVSGCKHFEDEECLNPSETVANCEASPNCYYKQLKRKEQECDMWKNLTIDNGAVALKYQQQLEACKMEAEEGKEINAELKAENEELKKIIKRLDVPKHEVIDMDIALENEKLKQTLVDIKEVAKGCQYGDCHECKYQSRTDCRTELIAHILQKISEV